MVKIRTSILTLFFIGIMALPQVSLGQKPRSEESKATFLEKIAEESNGSIIVTMPDDLIDLIFAPPAEKKAVTPGLHPGTNRLSGYRIQVFSDGRNQHSLEARAKARGSAIVARFPKYRGQVYSFSKAPNWYTRVGNFRNAAEASEALSELKRAFPGFASEMRAVKCPIVIVK